MFKVIILLKIMNLKNYFKILKLINNLKKMINLIFKIKNLIHNK
jgi:hypothetical protein